VSKNTRGANGSGYIRKRPDGRWEAMYSAGYDEKTGKLIRKSIYGKTQKEVRQKLTKVQIEIDEGTYLEPSKMTLSEWIDMWLKEYTFDKKYSTLKGYKPPDQEAYQARPRKLQPESAQSHASSKVFQQTQRAR